MERSFGHVGGVAAINARRPILTAVLVLPVADTATPWRQRPDGDMSLHGVHLRCENPVAMPNPYLDADVAKRHD